MDFHVLTTDDAHLNQMVNLACRYIRTIPQSVIAERLEHLLHAPDYYCFGLFLDNSLETLATGHVNIRLMTGKELSIDHVIVSKKCRSTGHGKSFLANIERWARDHQCTSMTVNTDLASNNAQAFYHRARFAIKAFHFTKNVASTETDPVESSQHFAIEI